MRDALVPLVAAFVAALILTPAVRRLALRLRFIAVPHQDRWHVVPTPKLGGLAIFLAFNGVVLATGYARVSYTTLVAAALMFAVGFIDDLRPLTPQQKLVLQLPPALIVIHYGLVLPWTGIEAVNIGFTLLWLVGITNAINLLDNMDGVAAGITAIASLSLAANFVRNGQTAEAGFVAIVASVLLGFLVYNFHPASIFMGDCGSNFIGFLVASTALLSAPAIPGRTRALLPVIVVPVLILLIPIFDTTFVAFVRKLAGRPSMIGGRDHTTHRLVALGLPERTTVLLLYALALSAGGVAVAARDLPYDISLALVAAVTIAIAILGFYLAGVQVYPADRVAAGEKQPLSSFLINLSYRHRVFEVLLDVALIAFAYYLAYRLHFGAPDDGWDWRRFLDTLPIVIAAKIVTFLLLGMYGGMWRYVGIDDSIVYVKTVAGASVAAVLVLVGVSRFEGLSRVAFVLDALILFVLVALTRGSFRIFGALLRRAGKEKRQSVRALIFGAGDAGEILLRELRSNGALGRTAVAFFDDDAKKVGRAMHGVPVLGGRLYDACVKMDAAEVIVSTACVSPQRLEELAGVCAELSIPLHQMRITIADVPRLPARVAAAEPAMNEATPDTDPLRAAQS